ncbi:MAG: NUDIX domain-containing protein [Tannerellaceae bacterium]|jgi:hypothetical protein|nr:NUDIX domain-containing protein [Tannerellaceae bacterium]
MAQFYQQEDKFLLSVDCIILGFKENAIHVLIARRKFEPLRGERSLLGGFVRQTENLHEAAGRVVQEYTGIRQVYLEQVGAYGDVGRDTGERVVSVVYYALIDMKLYDETLEEKHHVRWVNIRQVGTLIFDHNRFLVDTLRLMRRRTSTHPVGFNLLPEKFTLPQLHSLYEAIHQKTLDKRNFRYKILAMDILEKLEEKDKSASRKGAYYYRFHKEKYDRLLQEGFDFTL